MKISKIKLIIVILIIVAIFFVAKILFKGQNTVEINSTPDQYSLLDANDPLSSFREVVVVPNKMIESVIDEPWIIRISNYAGYSSITGEIIYEFSIASDGSFEWKNITSDINSTGLTVDSLEYEVVSGIIPKSAIENLTAQLEQFQPGELMEDASIIKLVWRDASDQTKMLTSSYSHESDISSITDIIESLVQGYSLSE